MKVLAFVLFFLNLSYSTTACSERTSFEIFCTTRPVYNAHVFCRWETFLRISTLFRSTVVPSSTYFEATNRCSNVLLLNSIEINRYSLQLSHSCGWTVHLSALTLTSSLFAGIVAVSVVTLTSLYGPVAFNGSFKCDWAFLPSPIFSNCKEALSTYTTWINRNWGHAVTNLSFILCSTAASFSASSRLLQI